MPRVRLYVELDSESLIVECTALRAAHKCLLPHHSIAATKQRPPTIFWLLAIIQLVADMEEWG